MTEDQQMIRDAARDYLADASDSQAVRAAMASEQGFDSEVWQAIASDLGWCGVAIDEAHDGMGLGVSELAIIQEEAGYRLLCAPFFPTVCQVAPLLQACASDAAKNEYLPRIATGDLIASLPLSSAADSGESTEIQAQAQGEQWQLSGCLERVACAEQADVIFVFAEHAEDTGLFAVETTAAGFASEPLDTWDATRRFSRMSLTNVAATRCDDAQALAANRAQAAATTRLLIAAEQLGAAQRCLDLTVEYASERKQFGRVIAGFQAVKHRCAQMMVNIESLRSAVYGVAAQFDSDAGTAELVSECNMAKALASDTLFYCAGEAIQLHGGVGFTWEYDPQLYFKRAQASKHWMGDADALRAILAEALL